MIVHIDYRELDHCETTSLLFSAGLGTGHDRFHDRLLTIIVLQVETAAIHNSGTRLDLTIPSPTRATSFTKNGISVTSTCAPYSRHYTPSSHYLLPYLFDHTFGSAADEFFRSNSYQGSCQISIELNQTYFVNNVRIFPTASARTRLKVGALEMCT